jgi:hypothetical protein
MYVEGEQFLVGNSGSKKRRCKECQKEFSDVHNVVRHYGEKHKDHDKYEDHKPCKLLKWEAKGKFINIASCAATPKTKQKQEPIISKTSTDFGCSSAVVS